MLQLARTLPPWSTHFTRQYVQSQPVHWPTSLNWPTTMASLAFRGAGLRHRNPCIPWTAPLSSIWAESSHLHPLSSTRWPQVHAFLLWLWITNMTTRRQGELNRQKDMQKGEEMFFPTSHSIHISFLVSGHCNLEGSVSHHSPSADFGQPGYLVLRLEKERPVFIWQTDSNKQGPLASPKRDTTVTATHREAEQQTQRQPQTV